ncbi:phosphoserine transaminase [Ammoniphilus oxalaticus]|uniref:Phosphoserine aminotransferase n=1 Tax=Ammoniphilus oxalaticus TaxID=66863 RepID=A0A419SM54_9BACL|nr:3-phosphoserine/phosphohydroxythreonine transaminase [Ammoniphilus oxalaticus]RKD25095.1 phosphoserine transaminase [Ammoniphilus oxalaticus]
MQQQSQGRVYNFNAGPSTLPLPVLQKVQEEFVNFKGMGMSVIEMSHRSAPFESILENAKALLKELLAIPDDYETLFIQGGASLQFTMIPMNFLQPGKTASYALTGQWAERAYVEAQLLGDVNYASCARKGSYSRVPAPDQLNYRASDEYLHITSNNTIYGTQWKEFPQTGNVPLIADMSSDILSQPLDISQFGLIYAGAQKNLGPSGVTVVIIRKDLLQQANSNIPSMLSYRTYAEHNSLFNTPPTFAVYMLGEVLQWVKDQGGAHEMAKRNEQKTALIYDAIDQSEGFFQGRAEPNSRSQMNITFNIEYEQTQKTFLLEAEQAGFIGIAGHRLAGGVRVSTYNAVSYEACQAFSQFMIDFRRKYHR